MANLVTVADVVTYMDIEFSNRQSDAAQYVLDGLEDELETYLGRPVTQRSFTEEYVVPTHHVPTQMGSYFHSSSGNATASNGDGLLDPFVLYLKNTPLVSVTSLSITDQASTSPTTTVLAEGVGFSVYGYGVQIPTAMGDYKVNVTYVAGLDGTAIPMMKLVILRAATRELQNSHDDVVGIKDLTTRNVAPLQTGFTDTELRSFRRHKRISVSHGLS